MNAHVPIQSLKIYTFLDIKPSNSAWIADAASFHGNGVYPQI